MLLLLHPGLELTLILLQKHGVIPKLLNPNVSIGFEDLLLLLLLLLMIVPLVLMVISSLPLMILLMLLLLLVIHG